MTLFGERLALASGFEMAAKGTTKAAISSPPAAQACIVKSEDAIANACARKLQQHLGSGHVGYELLKHATGASSLHFTTYPAVNALINGVGRPVLSLDDTRWLHLAIDLEFIVKNRWRIKHISIDILEGEATSLQKVSLLRAEWMMHDTAMADGHAQPHWHAIGAAEIAKEEGFEDFLVPDSNFGEFLEAEPAPSRHAAFKHFHYAMVTGWHREVQHGHCHILESQEAAISWIIGCVDYIQHQLAHVSKKGRKTPAH